MTTGIEADALLAKLQDNNIEPLGANDAAQALENGFNSTKLTGELTDEGVAFEQLCETVGVEAKELTKVKDMEAEATQQYNPASFDL